MKNVFVVVAGAAAFALLLTSPADACHKGGNDPKGCGDGGGGGGGGAKKIEARDTFRNTFEEVGAAIASDGGGPYEHKVDGNVIVGDQHLLQTGRLDKNDRKGFLQADSDNCDTVSEFNPFRGFTELTLAARADLYDCEKLSNTDPCECDDLSKCSADNFAPAMASIEFQSMAVDDVEFIATWAVLDPTADDNDAGGDLNKSWMIFDAGGLLDVPTCDPPGDGMPVRVECTAGDADSCTSWTMTGLEACFREQGDTTPATIRANCEAPFQVTVEPKP